MLTERDKQDFEPFLESGYALIVGIARDAPEDCADGWFPRPGVPNHYLAWVGSPNDPVKLADDVFDLDLLPWPLKVIRHKYGYSVYVRADV